MTLPMTAQNNKADFTQQPLERRPSRQIKIGSTFIGGQSPITVQSMTNTKTADIDATVAQIRKLEDAGCDIIRVAVPDKESALAISSIKKQISIPLVADIHFDYKLALLAINAGADKIRINPGNIGNENKIKQILFNANDQGIPIRIGVNSGSIEKDLLKKYGHPCAEAMVESTLRHIGIFEKYSFTNLVLALKSSDVKMMIRANEIIGEKTDFPLHLGVTEAGTTQAGLIKSAIGIGSLLERGIGDTIRVSLTADPIEEIYAGINILKALGLKKHGLNIISCPTCGRLNYDMFKVIDEIEKYLANIKKPLTVAIMGCVVNGPGEASEADIGIAGGKGKAVLFKKGKVIRTIKEDEITEVLLKEIDKF